MNQGDSNRPGRTTPGASGSHQGGGPSRDREDDATTAAGGAYAPGGSPPPYPGPPTTRVNVGDDLFRDSGEPTPRPDSPSRPGRLLGGRYELADVIGRGGMAEVRKAYDTRLGRWVAVKELRPDLASDPTFQARFRREAQSAAGLNHPHIVAVYDTGEEYDPDTKLRIPYIVMELVQGYTLRDILKDGRKILPERALELARGVLDALSYSHKAGIIHRDIKPANVMLTPQGTVKVMDFGIARAVSDVSSSMTQTAAVIGTAQYLSPEQARGETVDARSDIYSAGCLLYELLVGRPPFIGDSPVAVAYQHVRELPVPPSRLDDLVSPEMDTIALTALAKDPDERYQSARAMADDINRLLAGKDVAAAPPGATGTREALASVAATGAVEPAPVTGTTTVEEIEPEEGTRRRRAFPIVLGVLSLILVALLAAGLWRLNQPQPPAQTQVPQVTVPGVIGQQRAAAETEIRTARLVPEVTEVQGAGDDTVGAVTSQSPPGGSLLDPGRTVQLEVNVGPRTATIPTGLTGRSASEAESVLEQAGFTDVTTVAAASEPVEASPDTVLAVRPGEGRSVALTTEIVLEVATGVSEVPNWIGWNQASVEQDRAARGFTNVEFITRDTSDPAEIGTVLATDPPPGTEVERTDRIVVTIGQAPPPPTATPEPTPAEPTATEPSSTPTTPTASETSPSPLPTPSPSPQ